MFNRCVFQVKKAIVFTYTVCVFLVLVQDAEITEYEIYRVPSPPTPAISMTTICNCEEFDTRALRG